MNDQEFNLLLGDLDRLCAACIAPFTVMPAIADTANLTPQGIIANGTGSLINTGPGQFLVTNNHVYEAFQTRRAASDSILLLMSGRGGLGFLDISENRLVSRDRERDLAVLEIPVSHVRRQGKLFSTWNSWPPPSPAVGMPALIYGYPGEGRVPLGDSLGIRPLTMGRYVASVTDRHFSLADIHGDSEMRTPEGATPITSYGGISGSAVYIIQSNSDSFLAGFVYEANFALDIIYVTFCDHINADGTIRVSA